jgi:addiction module HigA family antidote
MAPTAEHPAEVLAQKLEVLGVRPTELGRQFQVPANRMTQIINGERAITGDSALHLAHYFGIDAEFWMNLQARHDLRIGRRDSGRIVAQLPHSSTTRSAATVQNERTRLASHGR